MFLKETVASLLRIDCELVQLGAERPLGANGWSRQEQM